MAGEKVQFEEAGGGVAGVAPRALLWRYLSGKCCKYRVGGAHMWGGGAVCSRTSVALGVCCVYKCALEGTKWLWNL